MLLPLLLILAQAAPDDGSPAKPAAERANPASPSPVANPASWFGAADYPAAALRERAQGSTGFRLEVDASGKVTGCTVTTPSGSAALDEATCRLTTQRARFQPATNAAGRAIAGTYEGSMRWALPQLAGRPLPSVGEASFGFTVGLDGVATDCRIVKADSRPGAPAVGPVDCRGLRFSEPFKDSTGAPVVRSVTVTTTTRIAAPKP